MALGVRPNMYCQLITCARSLCHLCMCKSVTNHGEEQVLVALKGNVPTIYMGITYNTPLEVLIPRAFPAEPPVVYVRPTAGWSTLGCCCCCLCQCQTHGPASSHTDMAIHSSHPIVDHGGRVAVTPWNAVQYTTCHVAALACPLTRARPCYLAQATRLVESIQHICLVFGSQPPLFKRASTTNTYQPQSIARTVSCCINTVSACACKALTPLGASLQ